jgi:hypothetical protein
MNKMLVIRLLLLLGLTLPITTQAGFGIDTAINGVQIVFSYSTSIFPEVWRIHPINAKGEQMLDSEVGRCTEVITRALLKYPAVVLKKDLSNIYFVRTMKFFDASYGGTNSRDAVYISNDGIRLGYSNHFLEQTFHHEFSSILFRNYPKLLDTTEWNKVNLPGFDYNDPENGVGSIRKNQISQNIDSILCIRGFLTEYSLSSIENDINTYAQYLFCPSPDFWRAYDKYPLVRKKIKLITAFYNRIDRIFTEEYFRTIHSNK